MEVCWEKQTRGTMGVPQNHMDDIAHIREKIDIVSLLSEYLPLKKMGRNFTTQCPFHSEKSPSFVVSPERQIWHCFGCGKGGDAYTFLMEYEHMEFPEALRMLAKRTGVTLSTYSGDSTLTSKKEQLYLVNRLAADFYHYILTEHAAGKKAMEYLLSERKISKEVINTFQIGFAPKSPNALVSYLISKKKYNKEDVIDAGLTSFRNGRLSDFFTDRIMFPLIDHRENVIGFSGRVMDPSSTSMGKYINTRETLVYHKGEVFFGLHSAKTPIKKENNALIMEGEFDVISAFQEGLTNAVAIKGTALTQPQVNLLSRFCTKVSLCFDMDNAGQQALLRSIPIIEKKGLTAVVVVPPKGKDPDEAIKENAFGFKQAVKHAAGVYDYLIEQSVKKYGLASEGKKQVSDIILPLLAGIENEIIKEHYMRLLANTLETSVESIGRQMEKLQTKEVAVKQASVKEVVKKAKEEMLEEYLLSLIIQSPNPKDTIAAAIKILATFMPKERAYQKILDHFTAHIGPDAFDTGAVAKKLPDELVKTYDTCFLYPLPSFSDEKMYVKEVEKVAQDLKIHYIRSQMKQISEKMKEKEKLGTEDEELEKLQESFAKLSKQLSSQEVASQV